MLQVTVPPSMKDLCPQLPTTACPDCSRLTTDVISRDPDETEAAACSAALTSNKQPTTVMWALWIAPWLILLPIIGVLAYLLHNKSGRAEGELADTAVPLGNMKNIAL
jgi:hypothetical protein